MNVISTKGRNLTLQSIVISTKGRNLTVLFGQISQARTFEMTNCSRLSKRSNVATKHTKHIFYTYVCAMQLDNKLIMFENRLQKVFKHKGKQARRMGISCYRLYDKDLPEFPITIELYDNKVYIAEYVSKHNLTEEEYSLWLEETIVVIRKVLQVEDENVFIKQRKRMNHRTQQYEKTDEQKVFFTVEESGLKFLVNLSDYLDTGLFLDHRSTRLMVQAISKEKRVLNLFCYTASFSVYAAAAGASLVTSVDLSKTYLQWAADNFVINKLKNEAAFQFVHADVLQYLKTIKPNSYDIVVMDPPTFSNSKRIVS